MDEMPSSRWELKWVVTAATFLPTICPPRPERCRCCPRWSMPSKCLSLRPEEYADGRGIVVAFSLGAAAVQIGTAYLFWLEAKVSKVYREALENTSDDGTAVTNVFTGQACARSHEPTHSRDRSTVAFGACFSVRGRRSRTFAREGRGRGLGRFYEPLVRAVRPTVAPLAVGPTYRAACGGRPFAFQPARREHAATIIGFGSALFLAQAKYWVSTS